ncbi:hypothetical protein BU24DRAFT_379256 [Aaosphaeria arxii CBS 175.79]|uniref:Vacuolar membrane-associated protein IML1 n=1 Tax=Aaosphaeria arxii CBS 175.79 TaxID=1450172 RepID=A0A6A5XAI3_9PLEO|nr:uncharacterized protein BU24DRAFT_379256 [Aaosphaeria arxii CBS 175.79]KAF2009988.1 hypothetical protein BU24DRAFT_379256 [Aaosphaeria arxii CBS 175.79]
MSKTSLDPKQARVQKVCTLWTHGDNFSRDDVIFNIEKFPELPASHGSLIQVLALTQSVAVRDFQVPAKSNVKDTSSSKADDIGKDTASTHHSKRSRRGSVRITLDENGSVINERRDVDLQKSYVFVAKPMSPELKSKHPNLQVSISETIAREFGLRNRMQVVVTEADEERHSASHVEITFRDEYLARADMWRMASSELSNRTVYRGQKLLFMSTIKATVKNVFINGQSTHSGYFSSLTKPVFRSESARFVLFIQMSKEMWNFDAEGAGEIMFNKVVNGFLPDLFKRWLKINARHLVTIILFTRMRYDENSPNHPAINSSSSFNNRCGNYRDYYRVVVSDMASQDWIRILYQLKKEFRSFLKDVSLVPKANDTLATDAQSSNNAETELVISGKPSTASTGNILEAINLAATQFAKDYIDRDLVRTGISIVVITAGTGVFEVDYNMLKLTTDTLVGSGIGIDLVCLSPMPLHSVPLFKYRSPRSISSLGFGTTGNKKSAPSPDPFTEQDDKTPRQHQANFGSIRFAHPVLPATTHIEDPIQRGQSAVDDWRYAMPHWLDISFWSGTTEEIIQLSKPTKAKTSIEKATKRKRTFALRCRMYEMQMMGVMENELGDISIPYLEEDPFYPHNLKQLAEGLQGKEPGTVAKRGSVFNTIDAELSRASGSPLNEEATNPRAVCQAWMDTYDDNVFRPLNEEVPQIRFNTPSNNNGILEKTISPGQSIDNSLLPSSIGRNGTSPSKDTRYIENGRFLAQHRSKGGYSSSPSGGTLQPGDYGGPGAPRADVLYRQMAASRNQEDKRPQQHRRGNSGDSNNPHHSVMSTPNDSPIVSRNNTPPKRSGLPIRPGALTPSTQSEKPTSWFLRQISFGAKRGATAAPTTSVATVDSTPVKVTATNLSAENNQKDVIAAKLASTKPSQPINIRSGSRAGLSSDGSPSSESVSQSVETVRNSRISRTATTSQASSVTKDPGSTFLIAGSRALGDAVGPKLDLSTSGGTKEVPRTISPTSAIAPWAVLVNPCNPKKNQQNVAAQFRRWQHIFPKRLKTSSVKWKSLCSPAAVPLTNEYFPTAEQLATEYNESPYKITQNDDEDVLEAPKSRESLVRELIAFRLSHGFQIIIGSAVAEFAGGRERDLSSIFDPNYMAQDGDTVFMFVGNTIHQLVCAAGGEVEVKRYNRKPTTALQTSAGVDTPFAYKPFIKTALEPNYEPRDVVLRPPRKEYNWNFIDTFLAGYQDEFSDVLRFWRARFVLIPVALPTVNRRPLHLLTEDSEEEIRLEGIRKLTQVWQRYRYVPPEERGTQSSAANLQKDPNPLAIEYRTRDPSSIVAAGPDSTILTDAENELQMSLFSETEQYATANIDIKKLADDLQGDKGIHMMDRRWHWKLHYNCFLGFDLTSWLLSRFKEIHTREEAVDLGNQLMEKGLFNHVQKRHQFRDGNFFYQIANEYRAPRPESRAGWFGMRRTDRSVPSTPLTEGPRTSPLAPRTNTKFRDSSSASESSRDGEKTPTRDGTPKRKVVLSRVMRYDVDPRRRSYRPEIISLHYDRLHNPDNCYHVRIDWMNVTAKLIEDAIVTWATMVEKYGLKLVEVPIGEACNIATHHPFRSPYIIKLARQPPQQQPEVAWDTSHFTPQFKTESFPYHKALLRRLDFVLDMEAASAFPSDVEVSYSWGNPDYKYTQFIHRTGVLLAQITADGDFLLLANRLAHNRGKDTTSRLRPTATTGAGGGGSHYDHKLSRTTSTAPPTPAERANPHRSPFSSPLARPVQPQDPSLLHLSLAEKPQLSSTNSTTSHPVLSSLPHQPLTSRTPEQIKDDMEAFCHDAPALQKFYDEAFRQAPSPSPQLLPVLDDKIPSLGLPPAISIREASPAQSSGWGGGGLSLASSAGGGGGGGGGGAGSAGYIGTPRMPNAAAAATVAGIMGRRQGSDGSGSGIGIPGSAGGNGSAGSGSGGSGGNGGAPRRQDSQGSAGTGV